MVRKVLFVKNIISRQKNLLPDHEGSVHIALNESGNVIEENLFSPFAEPLDAIQESRFSYEAKEYDSLVKDYDFHFRKYQPGVGFAQPDTLIQNVYDPQFLNRYSFERSNPLFYIDENGHFNFRLFSFGVSITSGGGALLWAGPFGAVIGIKEIGWGTSTILYSLTAPNDEETTDEFTKLVTGGYIEIDPKKPETFIAKFYGTFSTSSYIGTALKFADDAIFKSQRDSINLNNPNIANMADNSNKAGDISRVNVGSSSGGTSTLGSNTPQQAVKAAGGSTLKTKEQREASESMAAKIISRQRAAAQKSSNNKSKK